MYSYLYNKSSITTTLKKKYLKKEGWNCWTLLVQHS
jgi:hypothetical protein